MLSIAWRVSNVMITAASRRRIIPCSTHTSARRFRHSGFQQGAFFSDSPIARSTIRQSLCKPRGRNWSVTTRAASGKAGKAPKQRYLCQDCGEDYSQFHGQCPGCKAWESFTVFTVEPKGGAKSNSGGGAGARALARAAAETPMARPAMDTYDSGTSRQSSAPAPTTAPSRKGRGSSATRVGWVADAGAPRRLAEMLSPDAVSQRLPRVTLPRDLGKEVERVLGGGVVPGAMLLIGGDPGVGKSTLALQIAGLLGEQVRKGDKKSNNEDDESLDASLTGSTVLYASGEESVEQLASRAERLGVDPEVRGSEETKYSRVFCSSPLMTTTRFSSPAVCLCISPDKNSFIF